MEKEIFLTKNQLQNTQKSIAEYSKINYRILKINCRILNFVVLRNFCTKNLIYIN